MTAQTELSDGAPAPTGVVGGTLKKNITVVILGSLVGLFSLTFIIFTIVRIRKARKGY